MTRRDYIAALKYVAAHSKDFILYCKKKGVEPDATQESLVVAYVYNRAVEANYELLKKHGSPLSKGRNLCENKSVFNHKRRAHGSYGAKQ